MHRLWGQSPAECPEGVGEARPHVQCAGLGQSGKRPWGAPSRPAGDQGSDRRGEKHEPALTSRLRHHDLVRGWRGPVHRTRGARAHGNAAALPRGVPANVATVTPSTRGSREHGHCHAVLPTCKPNSLRRAAMLWRRPCGGTHFEIFRRKKLKILGQFPLLLSFPMGHGTSPPHSSGPSHTEPSPHPQGSPGIPAPTRRACSKAPSARRGRAMVVLKPGAGPPRHGTAGRPRHSRRSKVGKNRVTTPSRTEQL